jgi:hypothetical protein
VKTAGRLVERARTVLLPAVVFAAAIFLAWFINSREPARTWLLWPYAAFWAATIVWVICCASVGHAALRLLPTLDLRFRERLLFDFAAGVLLFVIGLFVVGILGGLRGPFYVVYPLALGALGLTFSLGDWRRAWRHFRAARRHAGLRPSLVYRSAFAFGTLGLTIVYLSIMVPDNAAFDARSYHLPLAEHFAAGGRIAKFPEGWFAGALPHLASWLYTWPFTLRTVNLFGHVELAAHLEFALFVVTVFSAPLLVEALCPGRRARGAWAVFFLFPGLFLYDSSLGIAADHVLAFWGAPVALSVARFLRRPSHVGRGALAGLMLSGAALTKYQSIYLLVPAGLAIAFVVVRELWRARRGQTPAADASSRTQLLRGTGALALAALIATAPHWLANVAWHGNPVYPQLRNVFPTHPLVPGWPGTTLDAQFELHGTLAEKVRDSAANVFAFSFVPHDWWPFHHDLPVFGFLFTLTLPVLLFARGAGRARVLAAGAMLGVFIWYWTYHEDRYLQALLPWMVACTAAALQLAWSAGLATRIGAGLLVALQLVWGNDVPWLPTHAMAGEVPAMRALRLLSSTFRGDLGSRLTFDTGFESLDRTLPKDAYVLLHEEYLRLGLNRRAIQDSLRLQAGIDYTQLARPDRVHDLLKGMGATHLVWGGSSVNHEVPISGELVFWGYALRYGEERTHVGGFGVAKVPARRPPPREPGLATYVGCVAARTVPLAEIDATVTAEGRNGPPAGDLAAAIAAAEFLVVKMPCQSRVTPALMAPFEEAPHWGDVSLWVRRL